MHRTVCLLLVSLCAASSGCHMYRPPGALLPSLAAMRQDRSIEAHAAASSFPSPSDVGLTDEPK